MYVTIIVSYSYLLLAKLVRNPHFVHACKDRRKHSVRAFLDGLSQSLFMYYLTLDSRNVTLQTLM